MVRKKPLIYVWDTTNSTVSVLPKLPPLPGFPRRKVVCKRSKLPSGWSLPNQGWGVWSETLGACFLLEQKVSQQSCQYCRTLPWQAQTQGCWHGDLSALIASPHLVLKLVPFHLLWLLPMLQSHSFCTHLIKELSYFRHISKPPETLWAEGTLELGLLCSQQ